jgi:hypothetical protein
MSFKIIRNIRVWTEQLQVFQNALLQYYISKVR